IQLGGLSIAIPLWLLSSVEKLGSLFGIRSNVMEGPFCLRWKRTDSPTAFDVNQVENDSEVSVISIIGDPSLHEDLVDEPIDMEFERVIQLVKKGFMFTKQDWINLYIQTDQSHVERVMPSTTAREGQSAEEEKEDKEEDDDERDEQFEHETGAGEETQTREEGMNTEQKGEFVFEMCFLFYKYEFIISFLIVLFCVFQFHKIKMWNKTKLGGGGGEKENEETEEEVQGETVEEKKEEAETEEREEEEKVCVDVKEDTDLGSQSSGEFYGVVAFIFEICCEDIFESDFVNVGHHQETCMINKDEALRAKEKAEDLMKESDFIKARKVAMKAQKMDKTLDGMDRMIMVDAQEKKKTKIDANSPSVIIDDILADLASQQDVEGPLSNRDLKRKFESGGSHPVFDPFEQYLQERKTNLDNWKVATLAKAFKDTSGNLVDTDWFTSLETPGKEITEEHMKSAIRMLQLRKINCHRFFPHNRVAIYDQEFIKTVINCRIGYVFDKNIEQYVRGKTPTLPAKSKEWVKDIDVIYAPHFNKDHWVVFKFDLKDKTMTMWDAAYMDDIETYRNEAANYVRTMARIMKEFVCHKYMKGISQLFIITPDNYPQVCFL
ncbi:unnamed protein product, partial [Cochlearia groenlandica]